MVVGGSNVSETFKDNVAVDKIEIDQETDDANDFDNGLSGVEETGNVFDEEEDGDNYAEPKVYSKSMSHGKKKKTGSLGKKGNNSKSKGNGKRKSVNDLSSTANDVIIAEAKAAATAGDFDGDGLIEAYPISTLMLEEVISRSFARSKRRISDNVNRSTTMGGLYQMMLGDFVKVCTYHLIPH